jgi:hypothetical protein
MTPDEKPPSREALAEEVAARLRAGGLDAVRDGENVTVTEPGSATGGASTGRNIAIVLGVTFGAALAALLLSLVWFSAVFAIFAGSEPDMIGPGRRAGQIGFTMALLIGGLGALITGAERRTPSGRRDVAALIIGLVLGLALLVISFLSLPMALDALTHGYGKIGLLAAVVLLGGSAFVGDRVFKIR